jgi:hypothetical protein
MDIPDDLGLPTVCPYDGEPWERYSAQTNIELVRVTLYCPHLHVRATTITSEQFLAFRLSVEPEKLLGAQPPPDDESAGD